ncbi:hypothetical protein SMICM304S_05095 [Streptomyces microflavus]
MAPTGAGRFEDQVELFADLLLADELVQVLGAQGRLDRGVLAVSVRVDQPVVEGRPGRLVGLGPVSSQFIKGLFGGSVPVSGRG